MPTYECPTCKKQLTVVSRDDAPFRPFCSHRCKMIDLGCWLDGTYSISEPIDDRPKSDAPLDSDEH